MALWHWLLGGAAAYYVLKPSSTVPPIVPGTAADAARLDANPDLCKSETETVLGIYASKSNYTNPAVIKAADGKWIAQAVDGGTLTTVTVATAATCSALNALVKSFVGSVAGYGYGEYLRRR